MLSRTYNASYCSMHSSEHWAGTQLQQAERANPEPTAANEADVQGNIQPIQSQSLTTAQRAVVVRSQHQGYILSAVAETTR